MIEGICGECLWYYEIHDRDYEAWYGFCQKHGHKHVEDKAGACESLRAWHIPEHVSLYNRESMLFPVK